ncbi:MAG: prepilin-type N-terminal cleavage/methylation domain-containing protein [Tepidisphaerales bacterium]
MWRVELRGGFTLVELLVVVGVAAVLLSVLLPAVARVRTSAASVATSAQLRDLTMLYVEYAHAHRGVLLPGFLPAEVGGVQPAVSDPASGHLFRGRTARMWPWRLMEWAGASAGGGRAMWPVLRPGLGVGELPQASDPPAVAESKAYNAALYPLFGLNTVFLGGHARSTATSPDYFRGFRADGTPNTGGHVAFRLNEVRRPAEQIVFTEVAIQRGSRVVEGDGLSGFHYVNPPRADRASGVYWTAEGGRVRVMLPATPNRVVGVPHSRAEAAVRGGRGRVATAFLDGHVELLTPVELLDMRRWAPGADRAEWDFE